MNLMAQKNFKHVICIENTDYLASLEKRKLYEALPGTTALNRGFIRVIDESGEDYLYPSDYFMDANLTKETQAALTNVAF